MPELPPAREDLVHLAPPGRRSLVLSWERTEKLVEQLAGAVVPWRPTVVAGVLQGGVVVAQMLADRLPGTTCAVLGSTTTDDATLLGSSDALLGELVPQDDARVLVVDEVIDSGRTMRYFLDRLGRHPCAIAPAALVASETFIRDVGGFAAWSTDDLPNVVLPWRRRRDLHQVVQDLGRGGSLGEDELAAQVAAAVGLPETEVRVLLRAPAPGTGLS